MLTAVITFKNEAEEVRRTVEGIRNTCGKVVEIHLINDASTDGYNYQSVAEEFDCRYTAFEESAGPAVRRNYGVDHAETPYVILLDAHMRFYHKNWHETIVDAIKKDPRALYCTVSKPLNSKGETTSDILGYGAYLNFQTDCAERYLLPEWNVEPLTHCETPMVPCVLGATYCFAKDFFLEIGGYVGLKQFGGEEAFISLKAWLMGGSCKVIRDVTIGHLYKTSEEKRWYTPVSYYYHNRLLLIATLFPRHEFTKMTAHFQIVSTYDQAVEEFNVDAAYHQNLREYLQGQFRRTMEYFKTLNGAFISTKNLEACFKGDIHRGVKLSIIIPTWNNASLTIACLMSLQENTVHPFHIIWVDNGSSFEQRQAVQQFLDASPLSYTPEFYPEPLGFAKAVNKGLKHVEGTHCVILNNDLVVLPEWDQDLVDTVTEAPGIAGPVCVKSFGWQNSDSHPWLNIPDVYQASETMVSQYLRRSWKGKAIDIPEQPKTNGFRNMLAFFCVLMPVEVMHDIGELDENFGWGYCEDDDYCHRARVKGYSLSLCPASNVIHKVGQTMQNVQDDHGKRLDDNFSYLRGKYSLKAGE